MLLFRYWRERMLEVSIIINNVLALSLPLLSSLLFPLSLIDQPHQQMMGTGFPREAWDREVRICVCMYIQYILVEQSNIVIQL